MLVREEIQRRVVAADLAARIEAAKRRRPQRRCPPTAIDAGIRRIAGLSAEASGQTVSSWTFSSPMRLAKITDKFARQQTAAGRYGRRPDRKLDDVDFCEAVGIELGLDHGVAEIVVEIKIAVRPVT